ncbi:hypothetical protein XU18_0579 [Perkinsela sp. CCAP 1560/4]|nr:hypothetical protein XU18_0579 [Perkinsela sp. CCAP 1560/4]|eukprot:KNH09301.1 hypothetical protein XU18_0579 [Perkinsela sp. CCAP 1560/4]
MRVSLLEFGKWEARLYTSSSPRKCEPAIGCDFSAPAENAKQHTVLPCPPKALHGENSAGPRGESLNKGPKTPATVCNAFFASKFKTLLDDPVPNISESALD